MYACRPRIGRQGLADQTAPSITRKTLTSAVLYSCDDTPTGYHTRSGGAAGEDVAAAMALHLFARGAVLAQWLRAGRTGCIDAGTTTGQLGK